MEQQEARAEDRRQRRKVPLGMGVRTLALRAIAVTDNSVGEAHMLPGLLWKKLRRN